MKTKKWMIVFWLVVVIGCVTAGIIVISRPSAREVVAKQDQKPLPPVTTPAPSPTVTQSSPREIVNPPDSVSVPQPANSETATNTQTQAATSQANQSSNGNGEIQDPVARVALAFVGDDPQADFYWATAINNPDLPADERRELIEDLNQDGFADTKNLGLDDLHVIENRLQLIEDLAPYSMDEINAAAFLEAYKDLLKMYARLTQ